MNAKVNPLSQIERKDIGCRQYWYLRSLQGIVDRMGDVGNDFKLQVCNEFVKGKDIIYGKWQPFYWFILPATHRLRLPYELIFEVDEDIQNKRNFFDTLLRNLKKIEDSFIWISDHGGRSPHVHFIPLNKKCFRLVSAFCQSYKEHDQQVNVSTHMIRLEGGEYHKRVPNTYSSYFKDFDSIVPVFKVNDVVFPEFEVPFNMNFDFLNKL